VLARLAWFAYLTHRHPGWRARLHAIRALARLDAAAFARWQEEAVRDHLAWARSSVPWHASRLRAGEPLSSAPILTRADLQRDGETLRARGVEGDTFEEASGGSTGEPVRLLRDRASATATVATDLHVLEGWGLERWCRRAFLWGDDRDRAHLGWRARFEERVLGIRVLNAFALDEASMDAFAVELEAWQPPYLQGYASALALFADFLLAHPHRRVRPRVVQSAAEALDPERRRSIERAFQCPVRDFYGSREAPSLAAECTAGSLHVRAEGRVIEIVDEDDRACGPGQPGRVLVTDLTNRAFGLVRYENGDVASWARDDAPCACGLPFPRLERVHGRTSDFVTLPSGERIHGEWFTHLFYGRDDVERFQVRQPSVDSLDVLTVGRADAAALAGLLETVRARVGPAVNVTWRSVEAIPPTRSGKHRFTVSDVPFLTRPS
jgi:phenylacetate-CoA ligase